jgi:hypothetical protein
MIAESNGRIGNGVQGPILWNSVSAQKFLHNFLS